MFLTFFFLGMQLELANKGAVMSADNVQQLVSFLHIFALANDNTLQVLFLHSLMSERRFYYS